MFHENYVAWKLSAKVIHKAQTFAAIPGGPPFSWHLSHNLHQISKSWTIQVSFLSPNYLSCSLDPLGQAKLLWTTCYPGGTSILLIPLFPSASDLKLLNHRGKIPFPIPSYLLSEPSGGSPFLINSPPTFIEPEGFESYRLAGLEPYSLQIPIWSLLYQDHQGSSAS